MVPILESDYDALPVTDKNDKLFVIVGEVPANEYVWWSPHMTSSNTPEPYVVETSSYQSGHEAWKAFDGNVDTAWWNNPMGGDSIGSSWIQFNFTKERRIKGIRLKPRNDVSNPLHYLPVFTLKGSNTYGVSWDNITTVSNHGSPTSDGWYEYIFGETSVAIVKFTNMSTAEGYSGAISEIEFLIKPIQEDSTFRLAYEGKQLKNSDGSGPSDIYSTEETRIGTWIDGKPLYRKVFTLTMPTSAGDHVLFQVNDDVDSVIGRGGWFIDSANAIDFIPMSFGVSGADIYIKNRNITIALQSSFHASGKALYLWLEYTKTTDQAESST